METTDEKLPQKLEKKYLALGGRSFKTKLDVYLFCRVTENKLAGDIIQDFLQFQIDEEKRSNIKIYHSKLNSEQYTVIDENWKLSPNGVYDKISSWGKNQKNALLISQLRNQYIKNFETVLSRSNFKNVYKEREEDRKCHYCGITQDKIEKLEAKGQINTKRLRGYEMEIDRENFHEYENEKIVLSCYWCNNAKTDEFTRPEFEREEIKVGIKSIWNERLKFINEELIK